MFSSEKKNGNKTTENKPLRKPSPLLPPTPNPKLPDDLLLRCFARVSRLYYPTLSLVSKSFRSLLASPELYQTRSQLDRTESCLYVCLTLPPDPKPRWFTLCRRPNRTLTKKKKKKKLSSNLLVPVASPRSAPVRSSFVAVGSDIYQIGGLIRGVLPTSTVSIFDFRSHSWHQAPNLQAARVHPFAKTIDGKIYVKGGRSSSNYRSANLVDVFDPETQTWTHESKEWNSLDDYHGVVSQCSSFCCLIDNVLYRYDGKARDWRILKGLEGMSEFSIGWSQFRLADYGGNMAVIWDRIDRSSDCNKETTIWCAEIALERCGSEGISGTVQWSDAVLKVPTCFRFVDVVSATV
ncbi:unnamed protein product [Microthlaspi erraticum]|uniref:F-box domain-containing protein n=1 Tax=Microthlaspi erraticum TaxID=1685480 RepID=A0A6D2IFE4_9BRAS|nr:unnamed protein product [Microthlaspi erraticum]